MIHSIDTDRTIEFDTNRRDVPTERIMGPCMSVIQANVPPAGPHEMYSPGSLEILRSNATFDTNGNKPFKKSIDLLGGSRTLVEAWNLKIDDASAFNVVKYTNSKECRVSKDARTLEGATPDVSGGDFGVWFVQAAPIAAPVSWCDAGKGNRQGIMPYVHAVDVYVSCDGKDFTDGHVCYGTDANCSKDQAIKAAVKATYQGEQWVKEFLTKGPSDGSKPWATLFRDDRWQTHDSFIYLPLMATDVDNEIGIDDKNTYVHTLLTKWAQLLGKVGAGEHSFTIRLRPRGVIFMDDDNDVTCDTDGGYAEDEDAVKKACEALCGQHLSDANAPGMSATFTLNIDAGQASGKGPVRKAQEFASDWPAGEIEECIELAMKFANTGVCGAKAAQMAPGSKCCHIILSHGDQGAGIKTAKYGKERSYEFFCAWALFKSKDRKPDSLGAQIKFVVKRDLIVDYRPVEGEWRSAGFETAVVGVDSATGLTITNAEIDAAIARDAEYY